MLRRFLTRRVPKKRPGRRKKPLQKLLIKNSPVVNRTHLKHRLIREGYLKNKCEWCGIGPKWRGKAMTLEMDHINGDNKDNRLENLRILCLHCHSQTPTFRRAKSNPHIQNRWYLWRMYLLLIPAAAMVGYRIYLGLL